MAGAATTPAPPTGTEVEEPKVPPVEGQPETETPSTEAAPEPEVEPNLDEVPEDSGDFEKFKDVLKAHPEVASQLKHIIGREKAFSEMAPNGSFGQMREILERIPTVADAEQLVADSESRREFGRMYREDAPGFVENLKKADPVAFQKFAQELPEVLKDTDPTMWSAQARIYVPEVLTSQALIAQQNGDQATLDACHLLAQKMGIRLGEQTAPPPRANSEVERLRREAKEREQADQEAAFNTFWQSTDEVVINDTVGQIEAAIKKAVPSATEAQLKRMVKEGYDRTLELMNQQPQTLSAINQYRESARKGKQGIAEHKTIIQFITGRTKLVVPKAVKGVIDEWSGQVLKLNTDTIQKKTALAAKTRDVGTGPGATTSAAAPTNAGQGKLHAKDIFAKLADGTYVPPAQRR